MTNKTGEFKVLLQREQDVHYKCGEDGEETAAGVATQDWGTLGLYSDITIINRLQEALERRQDTLASLKENSLRNNSLETKKVTASKDR